MCLQRLDVFQNSSRRKSVLCCFQHRTQNRRSISKSPLLQVSWKASCPCYHPDGIIFNLMNVIKVSGLPKDEDSASLVHCRFSYLPYFTIASVLVGKYMVKY
ncbi:hypothetical protein Csa_018614 [Cucumis sativus]|uniref:Uncharacterized protein n=1 Tax=Cucumis sativus TaxID=3659 RepID=A0A0A0LK23_CUCSA|nr:hypothetical protein Csa_018614 [Cucumis sativus]